VEWQNNTNVGHNVNGTKTTYPSNPESFGNSVGANWTYSHVFMTPGNYDYRCDPHLAYGMVGTITVETATSINYDMIANSTKMYPNPASEKINIEPQGFAASTIHVEIYNIAGKVEFSNFFSSEKKLEIDVSKMVKGIYFVKLNDNSSVQILKLVKN